MARLCLEYDAKLVRGTCGRKRLRPHRRFLGQTTATRAMKRTACCAAEEAWNLLEEEEGDDIVRPAKRAGLTGQFTSPMPDTARVDEHVVADSLLPDEPLAVVEGGSPVPCVAESAVTETTAGEPAAPEAAGFHRCAEVLKLARLNAHPLDARVRFQEEGHLYFVDGEVMGLSVTGLLSLASSEKFVPEEVAGKMVRGRNWPNKDYADTDEAGNLVPWTVERILASWVEAQELGTDLHGRLEQYLNEVPDARPPEGHKNYRPFMYALAWWEEKVTQGYEPWATEKLIFDKECGVAGSVDFIARNTVTGKFLIVDWKRCLTKKGFDVAFMGKKMLPPLDHLHDHKQNKWALQVNVYREILERNYGIEVEGMCMVVCHPDNAGPLVYEFQATGDAATLLQSRITPIVRV